MSAGRIIAAVGPASVAVAGGSAAALSVATVLVSAGVAVALGLVGCTSGGHDPSSHSHGPVTAKPYPLTKCLVTDEGFNHGKPYTFVHEGQEKNPQPGEVLPVGVDRGI